ncbi:MAG: hypothetical protein JW941_00235 [Candidatus Coatesbacteria bacterium]|nr:hypothetical protein [Candidatus Coatesbacteria bacterium]
MDTRISGDERGVKACRDMEVNQKDDLSDVLDAAINHGHAFIRVLEGEDYRIWEIRSVGVRTLEEEPTKQNVPCEFEIGLFFEGHAPSPSSMSG